MMNRKLSHTEIQYLLDHLDRLYEGVRLGSFMNTDEKAGEPAFTIPLSDQPLDINRIITIHDLPVLFPCSDRKNWYSMEGQQVCFHHDILKSAFYLLSGYQELHSTALDPQGRFPWKSSIQYKLGITHLPVVNYYFEVILEAFGTFCTLNDLDFRKKEWENPVLFLSHDVDRIKKYSLRNFSYAAGQLAGLRPGTGSFRQNLKNLNIYFRGLFSFKRDPYWTFAEMTDLENRLHIHSTWFFLEKTRQDNSRYRFRDRKMVQLISELSLKGHEVGIHGTLESSVDRGAMTGAIERLNAVCDTPVAGIRQHFLRYKNPDTPMLQSSSDLVYDATLGFAEQLGFRNSYTYPFKLYSFDNRSAMDIWELPLQAMEVTMLEYMDLKPKLITAAIEPLLAEVLRFNGVFSLLWHNCNLDEETYPGILKVYREVLKGIMQSGYVSLTGQQTLEHYLAEV
jgi:hypothetical protein